MICAAIVARVPDAAHLELMEDARLLRRMQEMKQAVAEEMQWIASISDFVWSTLGSVFAGMDADHLKSRCIKSAYVAKAMFHKRVFVEASKLPWSLTQGDIAANLNALAAGPRPAELVAWKIHDLLTVIGYSRK